MSVSVTSEGASKSYDLHRDVSNQLLAQLPEPKNVFKHLLMCMETPRPSHHLDAIRGKLTEFVKDRGLHSEIDKAGNLCIRKPATKGKEGAIKVCIQSHLDMVTSKTEDKVHDWNKDPITPIFDGTFIKADRTTLGADDGIGVAASLAILEDEKVEHGPLECIFTADEETTMGGAEFMSPSPFLQASVLINVDSEEDHSVCVGCAGGMENKIHLPITRVHGFSSLHFTLYKLHLHGLLGGHTGTDIEKGRANSLQLMARMLDHCIKQMGSYDIQLLELKGGSAPNAIPRACTALVYITTAQAQSFEQHIKQYFAQLRQEFSVVERKKSEDGKEVNTEIGMTLDISAHAGPIPTLAPLTAESMRSAIDLVFVCLHGVIRMLPEMATQVDTSISMSIIKLHDDSFMVHTFCRSFSDAQMNEVEKKLQSLARLCGASITPRLNYFPGWVPAMGSPALNTVLAAHRTLFNNTEPHVYSVHAGLECGLIQGVYPSMQCVSIGPSIIDAHSPDERMKVASVQPFYEWLKLTLINLSNVPDTASKSN